MEKVAFGTKVRSIGINRADVADGIKGKAVLLDKDPRHKNTAYDERIKKSVEVDQDAVIKYGFNPRGTYYFLIARLNTDMKGQVIGDDIVIEYIQLSDTTYTEYTDSVDAMDGQVNAIMLTKVKKAGPDGRDFSWVKASAANIKANDALKAKFSELRKNKDLLDAMWQMIDANTSITMDDYEKRLAVYAKENNIEIPESTRPKPVAIAARVESEDFGADSPEFEDATYVEPQGSAVTEGAEVVHKAEVFEEKDEFDTTTSEFDE